MKKILTVCSLALFAICLLTFTPVHAEMSLETFKEQATIEEQTAVIGTNIVLHQIIHGQTGTTYRYKLETDCPHWTYEDRYVSKTLLPFDLDHAAVETEAVELTVRWSGTVLATGQHFSVPLLGLESDDIPYETFKDQMLEAAYDQLNSPSQTSESRNIFVAAGTSVFLFGLFACIRKIWKKKKV